MRFALLLFILMVKVWHFYKLESRFYPEITLLQIECFLYKIVHFTKNIKNIFQKDGYLILNWFLVILAKNLIFENKTFFKKIRSLSNYSPFFENSVFAKITEKSTLGQKTFAISKDFRNFLWKKLLLIKSNQFEVILKVISSEYQYMSTNGQNGQFTVRPI